MRKSVLLSAYCALNQNQPGLLRHSALALAAISMEGTGSDAIQTPEGSHHMVILAIPKHACGLADRSVFCPDRARFRRNDMM
jgi:hypothetical protein